MKLVVPLVPELQRSDADVELKAISTNRVSFTEPVNDPMFSAHRNSTVSTSSGRILSIYVHDSPVTVMGCAVQVR